MADNEKIDTLVSTLLLNSDRHYQGTWYGYFQGLSTPQEFMKDDCGTTACAAGFTKAIWGPKDQPLTEGVTPWNFAMDELDLTRGQAEFLFLDTMDGEAVIRGLKYLKDHPHATNAELKKNEAAHRKEEKGNG